MGFFKKVFLKTRDLMALVVLVIVYHGYELFCYIISNTYRYYLSIAICIGMIFFISLSLICLHDFFLNHFSWDALKLKYLNNLPDDDNIPAYRLDKRLTGFVLRKGFWVVFVLGPIILGPFIITELLRPRKSWRTTLIYALSGSILNAAFWVGFMRGLGIFTWSYTSFLNGKFF